MSDPKILFIADPLSDDALSILNGEDCVQLENQPGLPEEEKLKLANKAHGIIVRSQTTITKEFLEVCDHLQIIVRAGVGVDNIDVEAATRKGVVVQNIPEGNTRSAAEHAVAMMMSLARNVPQAHKSLQEGKWDRKTYVGTELQGKTLGIVGLGKIGRHVLNMATGLGMKIMGFDPFISPQLAQEMGLSLAESVADLAAEVDFLSIHVPKSPETANLIDAELLSKAKKGLRLVNCARGGIVDEKALFDALEDGTVAGAALDVFEKEPPEFTDLILHPKVVCTPHLGASTKEAQQNVAIAACEQMLAFFKEGKLVSPINSLNLEPAIVEEIRPYHDLAYRLGVLHSQVSEGNPVRVRVEFFGDLFDNQLRPYLTSVVLSGFMKDRSSQEVNTINAHHLATEMGVVVEETAEGKSKYFHQMIRVHVESAKSSRSFGGTIRGQKGLRLVSLDDYHFDAVLEGSLLLIQNKDQPGMIGVVGGILSANEVNISYMSLGRDQSGGTAVALLNLDEPVSDKALEDLRSTDGILWAQQTHLPV